MTCIEIDAITALLTEMTKPVPASRWSVVRELEVDEGTALVIYVDELEANMIVLRTEDEEGTASYTLV